MSKTSFSIEIESEGQRLDIFLCDTVFKDKSRSFVQNLIKNGYVTVNELKVKTGYALKAHDVVSYELPETKTLDIKAVDLSLDIVYEDDDLMVINKPQGLVVHPASSYHEPTLVHGLLFQADQLSSINGIARPGIVHRIDKDTSGLLVVAKNDATHQALSADLSKHLIKRRYLALVYGHVTEEKGTIDLPIQRHPKNRLKMAVIEGGKRAVTHFKVIERFNGYTLLSCDLETGRTHQIRVHLSYIHHPIVGDPLYGPKDVLGDQGQFLHATELNFFHPTKKEHMTFNADMPQNFKQLLDQLR